MPSPILQVIIKKMHHRLATGETSQAAAHKVAKSVAGKRLETLQGLHALGGSACGEQIALATKLSILSIRPRLSELLEMELIKETTKRFNNTYGNNEIVWQITKKGGTYVR
tara:strand:+ start:825 stop:1157 length:333 start_codon:yes stop_codon:yes gene_type:complete